MKTKRMKRAVSLLLLLTLLVGVVPMTGMASAASAESAEPEGTAEAVEQAPQETDEEPAPVDSEAPEPSEEPGIKDPAEPKEDGEPNWMDAGLLLLVNGVYVPYNPITGEADAEALSVGTRALPTGITYSDVLGAHGSDLNSGVIKAGGIYNSWVYGDNAWYPYSTGVVASTGKRVITSKLFCNDGPTHYKTESGVLAVPVRPSQESGWSMDVNGYGNYTTRTSGVPSFKNESLYSKYVPNYSAATWTQINLVYGVARGMGGMTEAGNANITAAGSTLITNLVCGYIGLGSDKVFHGKPILTSNSAVNQQIAEILVRCEVYSKEKGLTGSATGDNTINALKAKGYTPTNTTGWFVASGTASSGAMWYFQINRSQSNGNQVYLYATNEITFSSGYTISLKKTTQGNADTLACIQNNPLYTLQGAVYEIHQGSATGTIVETLTTNANGEATGTNRYAVGTKLYAVEKTAPSGYLLNTTPVLLTISTGSNVFNVADRPTFDPNSLKLTKTGNTNVPIEGAVFKVQFFASNWADSTKLLRTWYFRSNAGGAVRFTEQFLASGYNSDGLFKIDGNVVVPLGCVQVTEVKAADGYLLPEGNTGKVFMFIRQGGTKTAQMGKPAGAYWGNGSADPLSSDNPKGIYTIENDADKTSLTAVNEPSDTSVEIIKTSTDGAVSGISFKVEQYEPTGGIGWWEMGTYQTNAQGKITIGQLPIGTRLRVTEIVPQDYVCTSDNPQTITLAASGNQVRFTNKPIARLEIVKTSTDGKIDGISFKVEKKSGGSWTALGTYVSDTNGKISVPNLDVGLQLRITETVPENYECLSDNPQTITLVKGLNRVSFENRPFVRLEIVKTSDNGIVEGISFRVEQFEPSGGIGWWEMGIYQTDSEGKILLDPLPVGTRLRITELVPDGYICGSENPQTVTLAETDNRVAFENRRIFGNLEIIKVDESYPDTRLSGAEFTVTVSYPGKEPVDMLMPEVLDAEGNGTGVYRLEHIEYGSVCLVRETKAPEGFLLSDKTFTVTIEEETTYNISDPGFDCLTNREKSGIIQVKKVDTQGRAMSGVSFLLEFSLDGRRWAPVSYRETDSAVTVGGCTNELLENGILVTDQNGVAIYPGLALTLGDRVLHYRLTEISTQNGMQLLSEPAFEGTLPYDGAEEITVTAVNSDGFTIPETGGNGFTGMSLGFAIAGGAALLLLLVLRKRRGYCV